MSIFELAVVVIAVALCIFSWLSIIILRHLFAYTHKLSQRLEKLEKKETDFVELTEWHRRYTPDNEGTD